MVGSGHAKHRPHGAVTVSTALQHFVHGTNRTSCEKCLTCMECTRMHVHPCTPIYPIHAERMPTPVAQGWRRLCYQGPRLLVQLQLQHHCFHLPHLRCHPGRLHQHQPYLLQKPQPVGSVPGRMRPRSYCGGTAGVHNTERRKPARVAAVAAAAVAAFGCGSMPSHSPMPLAAIGTV